MKDMVNERILQLSSAQERLIQAADIMDQLSRSQLLIEKHSYEAINTTDMVLSLSKEGMSLVRSLKEGGEAYIANPSTEGKDRLLLLLNDLNGLLHKIMEAASTDNELLHSIEKVADTQYGLTDGLKESIHVVSQSVEQAAACAEMVMAMDI